MTNRATNAAIRVTITTDTVPERERFAFWREACCEPLGLLTEPGDASGPFAAHVSWLAAAPFVHVRYQGVTRCHVSRGGREIARCGWDSYAIYRENSTGAWFRRGGQEFVTAAGDMLIADLDLPFETRALGQVFDHEAWLLPKAALAPYLPASGQPRLSRLSGTQPTTRLLGAYLDAIAQEAPDMAGDTLYQVTDTLCRLVALTCGADEAGHAEAAEAARLTQAKRYIGAHLAEPHLSPASVAAALGISVRSLHLAFAPTGSSVARHIQQRRMEECRRALLADPERPVTDIAFAWGFNSLSGFYRAFHAAFGATPSELRAAMPRRARQGEIARRWK